MKTIFITILEGVESKNILRTGVVDRILSNNQSVKVVLFVKNKERAEYYQKEFHHPRISYEVAELYEPNRLNKFFGMRKFHFLRTETTKLRATIVAEDRGRLYYHYALTLHWILARKFFVRVFRFLDLTLVTDNYFDKYFEKYKPDLILLADLFEDFETNFLRSAKKYKVFSIGLINSWDRVTARCILRILPDKFVVFNDVIKKEIVDTNYIDDKDIFVSGIPQYDMYFKPPTVTKEEFFKKTNISLDEKLIVYSPLGGKFSDSDWDIMDMLYQMNSENKFGDRVKILVRFPPNDFVKDEDLVKRPHLIYQYPGVRFSNKRNTDWDMTNVELEDLKNTLHYMSLMICYASSISVDSALVDKPVMNINFEVKENVGLSKSPTIFYDMTHYKKVLDTGGIRLVNNKEELMDWVNKYLINQNLDHEGRLKLISTQAQFTDGLSGERLARFVNDNLR
ncbi:MAG: CDP-glycerol glycerophosphotransferase family protein [Parcubacteria group bacterium]